MNATGSGQLRLEKRVSYQELVETYRRPIPTASDNLQQASQLLGQKIYESSAAQSGDSAESEAGSEEDAEEVVEAEIVDEGEGDGN